jgi:hypothetical protein
MTGKLIPQGEAPYDLGLSQDAGASASNGSVEMTLYVAFDGRPQMVHVRMTRDIATKAVDALKAAIEAELGKKK